jgi:hypothetical protein
MKGWSNSETPGSSVMLPEKRLLAAVLQRAITDYLSGDQDVQEDSAQWLLDDEPSGSPLTFEFVCEALDIDPAGLRRQILSQRATLSASAAENGAITASLF